MGSLKGKTVIVDYWATWCGACKNEIPSLIKFHKKYSRRKNFVFISICCDATTSKKEINKNDISKLFKEYGINYPVLNDEVNRSLMSEFGVNGWPTKIVLNEEGEIMDRTKPSNGMTMDVIETYLNTNVLKN